MSAKKGCSTFQCLGIILLCIIVLSYFTTILNIRRMHVHEKGFKTAHNLREGVVDDKLRLAEISPRELLDRHGSNAKCCDTNTTSIDEQKMHRTNPANTSDAKIISSATSLANPLLSSDSEEEHSVPSVKSIAIGLALSTRQSENDTSQGAQNVSGMLFFTELLPSFCKTYSAEFWYHFYIAYDFNDPFLSVASNVMAFKKHYTDFFMANCTSLPIVNITFLKVNYTKKPAWAQNDAMMRAYLDHHDYYYRLNDDTVLVTQHWQQEFIKVLANYTPPNVGVVGPSFKMGNIDILTYDFVHRTHIDIFGFYYPRDFKGFHGDRWMTDVYKPARSTKHPLIWIWHSEKYGQRYPSHQMNMTTVQTVIGRHQKFLMRFLEYTSKTTPNSDIRVYNSTRLHHSHVISFSLFDQHDETSLHGVLRNAVLAKQYFYDWTVRLTVPSTVVIPLEYENKLRVERVDIRYVNSRLPHDMLRYLVIDDAEVEYVLIGDAHTRLGARNAAMVEEWTRTDKEIHCIFDNPAHPNSVSQWGGKAPAIHKLFATTNVYDMRQKFCIKMPCNATKIFANVCNMAEMRGFLFSHDTVSCSSFNHRFQGEYIEQRFDINEIPLDTIPEKYERQCRFQEE